ncbi:hypothetical protein SAMN05216359_101577 [Roseateles sp. YR242]|nr:hypothetical protein SAMN05216359_101577 [Roseateles sp. YR242]
MAHGEPESSDALRQAIEERFGWSASVRSTSTPWPGRWRFDRQAAPKPPSPTNKESPCAP